MARGYHDPEEGGGEVEAGYRPSRPARRVESLRGGANNAGYSAHGATNAGYSAHYAESPVIVRPDSQARSLPRPRYFLYSSEVCTTTHGR